MTWMRFNFLLRRFLPSLLFPLLRFLILILSSHKKRETSPWISPVVDEGRGWLQDTLGEEVRSTALPGAATSQSGSTRPDGLSLEDGVGTSCPVPAPRARGKTKAGRNGGYISIHFVWR